MVGAFGDGAPDVPRHVPHLLVPADAIRESTWAPGARRDAGGPFAHLTCRAGPSFKTAQQSGVQFRDRPRPPHAGSPIDDPDDDRWEDIVWLADYSVLGASPQWREDPAHPPRGSAIISFTAALGDGSIRPGEPRSRQNRESHWAFDPQADANYVQGFSDRVQWQVNDNDPILVSREFGSTDEKSIAFGRDCAMFISALSRDLPAGEDPDRLVHFTGSARSSRTRTPGPCRQASRPARRTGEATVEPLFCLMAAVNEFE
jgi:hypothetical protein